MRKHIPNHIKLKLSALISKKSKAKFLRNKELKRISKVQRNTKDISSIFEHPFVYTDSHSFYYAYLEIFEDEIYKFKTEKHNPLIIDAGANIGLSILYFKKLFPSSEIIAFEADPTLCNIIHSNSESFNLKNITLVNKALWDEESEISFNTTNSDNGRISNTNVSNSTVSVKTTCLSNYLNREIDVLKIDIEGAEFRVLKECKDKLIYVRCLFVEYHSFENEEQHLDEILNILKSSGFIYHIKHVGISSRHPFLGFTTIDSINNNLNIFALNKRFL